MFPHLSPRQQQVLESLATEGGTYEDVARRLGISRTTVKTHVGAIMRRLDVRTKTELVAWAIRSGWVSAVGRDEERA